MASCVTPRANGVTTEAPSPATEDASSSSSARDQHATVDAAESEAEVGSITSADETTEDEPAPIPALPDPPEGTAISFGPPPPTTAPTDLWVDDGEATLVHSGLRTTVRAHATQIQESDEEGDTWTFEHISMHVRITPESTSTGPALHFEQSLGDPGCDSMTATAQALGTVADGRLVVDAQLACRSGEDFFSATNDHHVLLVDPDGRRGWLLWSGQDESSDEMGVCSEWSIHAFELEGEELVVQLYDGAERNRENARELDPESRPQCRSRKETKEEVARVRLPGPATAVKDDG